MDCHLLWLILIYSVKELYSTVYTVITVISFNISKTVITKYFIVKNFNKVQILTVNCIAVIQCYIYLK